MARTIPMGEQKCQSTSHNTHFLKTEIRKKNTYNTNVNTKENTAYMQHNHTEKVINVLSHLPGPPI